MHNGPNESAFPTPSQKIGGIGLTDGGLTKREYIASQALAGLLASPLDPDEPNHDLAQRAVWLADALIAELNKPVKEENDERV